MSVGSFTLQGGAGAFEISRDPRLGIVAAKLKVHAPDLLTALLAPAPDIGIAIPEWNPRTISQREAGSAAGYDVGISYEGHPFPDEADGEYFEMEGTTADEPIETHWNLDVLLANYPHRIDAATQKITWNPQMTDGSGQKGRSKMAGVESYPAPGLIWTRNWCAPSLPSSIIDDLGVIFNSLPGNPRKLNNPPGLTGGRVWLCIRVRARQRGNLWQLAQSWQLSGPHGYVPEMYPRVR